MGSYTVGEVTWLLALTRRDAIEEDLPGAAALQPTAGDGGADRVPTLARWSEVRAARDRVLRRRAAAHDAHLDAAAVDLVARGYTQQEAATVLGTSQQTVSRHVRATLGDIVDELNGTTSPTGVRIQAPHRPRQVVRLLTAQAAT